MSNRKRLNTKTPKKRGVSLREELEALYPSGDQYKWVGTNWLVDLATTDDAAQVSIVVEYSPLWFFPYGVEVITGYRFDSEVSIIATRGSNLKDLVDQAFQDFAHWSGMYMFELQRLNTFLRGGE